ncbi:3'-5' DNA helicase [Tulasnella sp. JGI-2019a]|nr:3'-5' DNA helicase [Tulasnella sp. JGI-2019a]
MKLKVDRDAAREWVFPTNRAKRAYQFNIISHSLFENCLVALPTGLGKTFIAGVIMMNYYRWFPEGKVVFVAPTKPLVSQQIEACRETCGIAPSDSVELTGKIPRGTRAKHWANKRVFFMTPQTLYNDLYTQAFDPLDIVLVVVDEAHRATGDYAYSTVVRILTAFNPHFRLLALTATPGSDPEKVQNVVDNLHISHIEIRDEKSLDLREYVHEKKIVQTIVPMEGDIEVIRDLLAKVMDKDAKKLSQSGVMHISDVTTLHPFRCTRARQDLRNKPGMQSNKWAWSALTTLGVLARAMGYLLEQSMSMCYKVLKEYTQGVEVDLELDEAFGGGTKKKKKAEPKKPNQLLANPDFKRLMGEMENQRTTHGGRFPSHPKVDKLLSVLLQYFSNAEETGAASTRVMVFVTFRDCVDEIVEFLNGHRPTLRATRFVGQGTDKSGKKGIAQKDQIEVIRQFKADKYNVLVATSIGEEGLDIGEVDLIICYDSQKTPIRMLQRIGRTGRMRDGRIEIFSAQGREEENYNKAQVSYKEIQKSIQRGEALELFADVPRLIPDDIKPKCVEKVVEIPPAEDIEAKAPGKGKRKVKRDDSGDEGEERDEEERRPAKKKKRKSMVEVPLDAFNGFVPANQLVAKSGQPSKSKPKPSTSAYDVTTLEDDSDDERILTALEEPKVKLKSKPKSKAQPKPKQKPKQKQASLWDITADYDCPDGSPLTRAVLTGPSKPPKAAMKASQAKSKANPVAFKSAKVLAIETFLDEDENMERRHNFDDDSVVNKHRGSGERIISEVKHPKTPLRDSQKTKHDTPIIISSSDDEAPILYQCDTAGVKTAILSATAVKRTTRSLIADLTMSSSPSRPPTTTRPEAKASKQRIDPHSWLLGSDDLPADVISAPVQEDRDEFDMAMDDSFNFEEWPPTPAPNAMKDLTLQMELDKSPVMKGRSMTSHSASRSQRTSIESPDVSFCVTAPGRKRRNMPPPSALPLHISSPSIDLSFPVRGPKRLLGQQTRNDDLNETGVPSSPSIEAGPSSPAAHTARDKNKNRNKRQKALLSRIGNALFEMEADHSGDEESVGGSEFSDENEYDRSFVTDGDPTQAPDGYDQDAIYRQGLMTQAPDGLAFRNGPVRKGQFTARASELVRVRERRLPTSSPEARSSEPDEYEMGSFIVEDDDDILELSSER